MSLALPTTTLTIVNNAGKRNNDIEIRVIWYVVCRKYIINSIGQTGNHVE